MTPEILKFLYTETYENLRDLLAGVTDADSLSAPPGTNSLNWLAGHVVAGRTNVLAMLKAGDTVWTFVEAKRYITGSEPVTPDSGDILPMDDIRAALDRTQTILVGALDGLGEGARDGPVGENTLRHQLAEYANHEAFHTGQIDVLVKLLDKS